jgi:hypothetical protein
VGVSCAVEEDAEDDVKDDSAACHDHHRVGVDLEVVSHDSADGEEEKDASDVPNLKIDVHRFLSRIYTCKNPVHIVAGNGKLKR